MVVTASVSAVLTIPLKRASDQTAKSANFIRFQRVIERRIAGYAIHVADKIPGRTSSRKSGRFILFVQVMPELEKCVISAYNHLSIFPNA
ncbi:hypothetical protein ACLB1N_30500 [Escherichia coli]